MEETWYIRIIRHFEGGRNENELYVYRDCYIAKEFGSKKEVQEFIAKWLSPDKSYRPKPGECAEPTYEPVTAAMFKSA